MKTDEINNLIQMLSALLSPVVAIAVAVLAYQSHKLNKSKHRFELYDKRFKVFEEINNFLGIISSTGTTDLNNNLNLIRGTNQSVFLFDIEVGKYIEELYLKATRLNFLETKLNGHNKLPIGIERTEISNEHSELLVYFGKQFKESGIIFIKYLKFDKF